MKPVKMKNTKQCPFCRHDPFVHTGYDTGSYYWIECTNCGMRTRTFSYDASPSRMEVWFREGKRIWNNRVEE